MCAASPPARRTPYRAGGHRGTAAALAAAAALALAALAALAAAVVARELPTAAAAAPHVHPSPLAALPEAGQRWQHHQHGAHGDFRLCG